MRSKRKLIIIFLTTLIFSFLMLTGLYTYTNRSTQSGFVFIRLARWIYNIEIMGGTNFDLYDSGTLFGEFYLINFNKVTGLSFIEIIYIPVFTTLSIFLLYFFTKTFISDKRYAILLAITILFLTEGQRGHFREYSVGIFLYPFFLALVSRYIKNVDKRYLIMSLFILLSLKFYAPHYEIWSVSFLVSLILAIYLMPESILINPLFKKDVLVKSYKKLKYFTIFSLVLLFSHQPKGERFLYRTYQGIYSPNVIQEFYYFIYGILNLGQPQGLEYSASPQAPYIPRMFNIIITLLLTLLLFYILIRFFYIFLQTKNISTHIRIFDILIFISVIGIVPHALFKLSIGQSSYLLRPIYLIGPVFIFYFLMRLDRINKNIKTPLKNFSQKKLFLKITKEADFIFNLTKCLIILIIVLSMAYHVSYFYYDTPRSLGSGEVNDSIGIWYGEHTHNPSILTDHHTYGTTLAYMRINNYSQDLHFEHYTDSRYSFIIGKENITERYDLDYLFINKINIDETMQSEDWMHYEPLEDYIDQIERNKYLNKVYSTDYYVVYQVKG